VAGLLAPKDLRGAPEMFATPASRSGDAAEYSVSMVVAVGGQAFYTDSNARVRFERLDDRLLPTGGGSMQPHAEFVQEWRSDPFTWSPYGPGYEWDPHVGPSSSWQVEGAGWQATVHDDTGATVAAAYRLDDVRALASRAPVAGLEGTILLPGGPAGPCGFSHSMQGQARDLRGGIRVHGACPPPLSLGDVQREALPGPVPMRVSGEDEVQGRKALVFSHPADLDALRLWFTAENPYPVRILSRLPGLLEGLPVDLSGVPMPTFYVLYDLVEFRAGPSLAGSEVAWHSEGWEGNGQLGPQQDVAHEFGLAAALAAARDDRNHSGVRDFLARHPDAAIVEAEAWTEVRRDERDVAWRLRLSDGANGLAFTVTLRDQPYGRAQGFPLDSPLREKVIITTSAPAGGLGPAPDDLRAATAPRVSTLWALAETQGITATAWGLHTRCVGACDEVRRTYWADAQVRGDSASLARLVLTEEGLLAYQVQAPSPYPEARFGSAAPVSDAEAPWDWGIASAGLWSFPQPKTVAGVTAIAALVGALIFFLSGAKGVAWGLFSRIEPDELMEHPVRSGIVAHVQEEPGIHFQELVRRTGKGRGTVEHHLRKLVAGNILVERAEAGFTCYFPRGQVDYSLMAAAPLLKSPGARQVLQAVVHHPGVPALEVATHLGLAPSTVNHHVKKLTEAALVAGSREGRFVRLHATRLGQEAASAFGAS
jgi:predicted transcriptional regulator